MYQAERALPASTLLQAGPSCERVAPRDRRIGSTVVLLGVTSMLTDISAEMVATVMPIYIVFQLGMTPLAFGLLEGMFQAATTLLRLASGVVTDRWQRPKEVATTGYALSALAKLGLVLLPGGIASLAALTVVDRVGKGIRTSPRDALIASDAPAEQLAGAFGVHRALDTAGAMLGPFVALGVLTVAPRAFGTVFSLSACIALVGVAVIALLVHNPVAKTVAATPRLGVRAVLACVVRHRELRRLLAAASLLGLATASDAFIFLALQRRAGFSPALLPLLYVASAAMFVVLAIPAGRLADRFGRKQSLLLGYGLLLAAYAVLLVPDSGLAGIAACIALLGAYYAATDGTLTALVVAATPVETRATSLALVTTATSLTRLVSSVAFGAIWSLCGIGYAVVVFACGLAVAIAVSMTLSATRDRGDHHV